MPGTSIGPPASATSDGFQKFRVHRREFQAFEFFEHLAASVRTVRQFPCEHLGKAFLANLKFFQLVMHLGCDCECDRCLVSTVQEQ